jgi:Xaa-Pro aminopeptidase
MSERRYFQYPWDFEGRKQYLNLPFPVSEYERRARVLKQRMEKDGLQAVFLCGDVRQYGYIRWLTNFYPQLGQSMAVLPLDGDPILVTTAAAHGEPMHSFIPETWLKDVRAGLFHALPTADHPTLLSLVKDVIREKGLGRGKLGIVSPWMLSYELFHGLKEAFPDVVWIDWARAYEEERAVKTPAELAIIEKGAHAIDAAFEAALKAAKPGVTEFELAGILDHVMHSNGCEAVANLFDTRVASGPRSALKNGKPTNRKLERGDSLFMDISALYQGYCMDTSTSQVVDADPTPEQLSLFETSALMTEAMITNCKPGVRAADLVEITRKVAEENGQGHNFIEYIVGHGMGASQLEMPHFNPDSKDVLAEGMVFALEPMVVDPVIGTGTIERICAVGSNGGRLLSRLALRPWTVKW